ncbi:MAG: competence/damage-inducible protein A [Microthrixaceae bacterium]
MNVEVVAIGTELLLGQITDTNSTWIGEQLALVGLNSHYQTKVGDNLDRIVDTLRLALERSDAVICCGGLGPTQDDLTREAFGALAGEPLEEDEAKAEQIIAMFAGRGRRMPMNNLAQARKPASAAFIPVQPGTAPGLVLPLQHGVLYAVPGVPWEMKEMLSQFVLGDLSRRSGNPSAIASRTLRTWGESESGLAEILAARIEELDEAGNPTLAFLASGVEGLKVRVTAKAADVEAATAIVDDEADRLRGVLGQLVFGADDDTMESVVLAMLAERGWTLGVAESLTGGMLGSRLAAVPGASEAFRGGVIAYDPAVKREVLGVPDGPVVTEATALAMARGVRAALECDVGLGTTGVAGPDELEGRPAGTVCLAAAWPGGEVALTVGLPGRRQQVREFSCITVLDLLRRNLSPPDVPAGGR